MLNDRLLRNLLLCVLLANIVLIGLFAGGVLYRPDMVAEFLPGKTALSFAPDLSGNWLFFAALILVNAGLLMVFGLAGTLHAIRSGLHVSPLRMRSLFETQAGFASESAEIVAAAIQEEQKRELPYVRQASWILLLGVVLFGLSLPLLMRTALDAGIDGQPLFVDADSAVTVSTADTAALVRFTVDQLAGAVLLDAPEIFRIRFAPLATNPANIPFATFILIYRTAMGLGLLLLAIAFVRREVLVAHALETPMPVSDIVALEAHGHHHIEPAFEVQEPPVEVAHDDAEEEPNEPHHEDHAADTYEHSPHTELEHHEVAEPSTEELAHSEPEHAAEHTAHEHAA